jgi:hypothetical protein
MREADDGEIENHRSRARCERGVAGVHGNPCFTFACVFVFLVGSASAEPTAMTTHMPAAHPARQ